MTTKELTTAQPMLHWQYKSILKELGQISLHASSADCPCNQVDLGADGKHHAEYCLGKHLLNVNSLCEETALMDSPNRKMLETLAIEAEKFHEKAKTIYCKGGTWPDLSQWSRDARKKLEPIYYACKAHLKQDCALAQAPVVTIAGKCGSGVGCSFKVKGSVVHEGRTEKIAELPLLIEEMSTPTAPPVRGSTELTFAIGPTGTRYDFEYRIVDADSLIVSHDPFTFEPSSVYSQKLQPRIRDRAATKVQVETIAATLDPEQMLLDFHVLDRGAPIVGSSDMLVESGNGRMMALKRAIQDYPYMYARYVASLSEMAASVGYSGERFKAVHNPVLVRVRLTEVDRPKFAKEANEPPAIEMSAIEKAKADAQFITAEMLAGLDVGEQSIEEALRAQSNRQFAQAFLAKLPTNVQAGLVDSSGQLNQDGIRRMVRALFVRAFPGEPGLILAERFFESTDPFVRNVFNGIAASLGILTRAEVLVTTGQREAEYAIAADLARVIPVYASIKSKGQSVEDYLGQGQLTARELTPFQETVLVTIDANARSGKRIGAILRRYSELVLESPPPQQASFMVEEKPSRADLWAVAAKSLAAVAQSPACSFLERRANINMTRAEFDAICNWRPLADFIAWAISVGKVRVWAVGLVPGTYQVSLTTTKADAKLIDKLARKIPTARKVMSAMPGEWVYEIVMPAEEKPLLTWSPQDVQAIQGERGEQARLMSSDAIKRKCGAFLSEHSPVVEPTGVVSLETSPAIPCSAPAKERKGADMEQETVRITGKCGEGPSSCAFTIKPDVASVKVTGVTELGKAVRGMTGDSELADPILAAIAAQIGLLDPKGLKKCVVVGKAYHCRLEPAQHFDPDSFRTVKAVHGSPLPAGVSVTVGCPKGEYDGLQGLCKVGTRAQRIMYDKAVCAKHEGCRV